MKLLQAIDSLKEAAPLMMGASLLGSGLLGYNPFHAVFGSVGQLMFMMGKYVMMTNSGKKATNYPAIYWVVVIIMGAVLAFMCTPVLGKYVPWEQYFLAFLVGALAQNFVDLINRLYKKFTKNHDLAE